MLCRVRSRPDGTDGVPGKLYGLMRRRLEDALCYSTIVNREREFAILQQEIVQCRKCPRLVAWREQVAREKVRRFSDREYWGRPVPAFGEPGAALIIIGLAPAAHGGNRTGRIFTGDRSGDWLYEALHKFGFANQPASVDRNDGLMLNNCLVTAVLRCAPPQNKPLHEEINNCRAYLRRELRLADSKRVVVALGRLAFQSFVKIWREDLSQPSNLIPEFAHGAECALTEGIALIASYHPSQQNTQTGKLTRPMFHNIFRRTRNILEES
jgi:uracil-DNA glycosylase